MSGILRVAVASAALFLSSASTLAQPPNPGDGNQVSTAAASPFVWVENVFHFHVNIVLINWAGGA